MKKSIYIICFALITTLLFAGCQKEQASDNTNTLPQDNISEADSTDLKDSTDSAEIIGDSGITPEGKMDSILMSFGKLLGESGLMLNDKTVKDAASIGALEGYSFNINEKSIEIYLFDVNSSDKKAIENLETAKESGFVTIFGVEINGEPPKANCEINGNMVLLFPLEDMFGTHPDKEGIVQAFMKIL